MIIVKLDGGMGNQLFQYAVGKYLAGRHSAELKLDIDSYTVNKQRQYSLDHFAVNPIFSTKKEKRLLKLKEYFRRKLKIAGFSISPYWYTEQELHYDDHIQRLTDNVYLEGFWQSEKYFKPIENIIRAEFIITKAPSGVNKRYIDKIKSVNAISLHVRRGDYITNELTHSLHGVCDIDYYRQAVLRMAAEVTDPHFFVFSDDMEWTKDHLLIDQYPADYIDHNTGADYEDLRLMYSCKYHIIANSSFSWWGAWLNNYPGKIVIAPKKWFRSLLSNNDIIPREWITL